MGEKKSIVRSYVSKGLKVGQALELVELSNYQYYGKPAKNSKGRGRPVSTHTRKYVDDQTIELVKNEEVVDQIEKVLEDPDTQYGYKRMTAAMMLLGYMIGSNKIYRLMKQSALLQNRRRPSGKKRVRGRTVEHTQPLQVLSMDIKQVWVEEYGRDAYTLTIIDTFTRVTLYRSTGYHMRQYEVKSAWEHVIGKYLQPADLLNKKIDVEIRCDNGPQFAAKMVREFLKENNLNQAFTYPYCPEQNGHIESFHAILAEHLDRFHFRTLADLEANLDLFYDKYNRTRLHGSIGCLPPVLFWHLWEQGKVKMYQNTKGKTKFKITIPYWKLSGNGNLREFPIIHKARRAS